MAREEGRPSHGALATRRRRFVARAVDQVLLYFVSPFLFIIALAVVLRATGQIPPETPDGADDSLAMVVLFDGFMLGWLAATLIEVLGIAAWGQTPGKKLLGIRVVRAQGGRRIGLARSAARFAAMWGSLTTMILAGISGAPESIISACFFVTPVSFAWAAWDSRKQCLHDKACGSVVVRTQRPRRTAQDTGG